MTTGGEVAAGGRSLGDRVTAAARFVFVQLGILPVLLVVALVVFSLMSGNFLTLDNLYNVLRQSSFLIIVTMGQMFAILTGGFDLSVGTIIALASVVSAWVMVDIAGPMGMDRIALAIAAGILAGAAVGILAGLFNGIGVAVFNVSPFIMTLGTSSIGFGLALYITGGVPVYGMPTEFSDIFGYGSLLGLPAPMTVAIVLFVVFYLVLMWTPLGRYIYAVGGNIKAANLSGVNTRNMLLMAYIVSGFAAAIAGILLTARLETGEANIGQNMPLYSIAAAVIGGASLRGGVGRIQNVVMGAILIALIENGMNLARIESYLQMVVIGALLVLAVIADQLRLRLIRRMT